MDEEAASRDHVGSLERGLAVMEILARHPSGMTLTEMAEEAGLTRAGARRFLLTLVATGYATQDGRVFSLSPRLLAVARTWLGGGSLWSFAAPIMRTVATQLNEACSAAILSTSARSFGKNASPPVASASDRRARCARCASRRSSSPNNPIPYTRTSLCWAAFTNTRRGNSDMDGDLDNLNWNMARQVGEWRVA